MSSDKDAMRSLLQTQSIDHTQIKFGQENIGELKNHMKQALKEEYDEFKSGIRPSIAYKIYPWRRYLNKVFESEVPDYKMKHRDEKSLPPFDPIAAMITVYHDPNKVSNINDFVDYSRISSVRCINGIFKIHQPPLRITEEKTPYFPLMNSNLRKMSTQKRAGYALSWPLTDPGCGPSIYKRGR